MNDTTRRFPRTLREAFPPKTDAIGITGPVVIKTSPPLLLRPIRWADAKLGQCVQCAEFMRIYRQYRKHHGRAYSARIAFGCAFRGLPF